jgi:hypothetical protein
MERIKQAIENAKKPGTIRADGHIITSVHSQYTKHADVAHGTGWNIFKYVSAVVLIFFAGWLWLRLDFLNQLELIASEYIHDGIKHARAEVKRRAVEEEKFKHLIHANFTHCQAVAEKNKEGYLELAQNDLRIKNKKTGNGNQGKLVLSKAALNEAAKMLEDAKAECRQIYETQLKNGI